MPNLYPAFERQEVVVHTPRHVRTFAHLTDDEIASVTEAWIAREGSRQEGYFFPLINEGRVAGASLPHSHSQLVWLPETPPAIQAEKPGGLAELFNAAGEQNLIVDTREDLVAFCHPVGRLPYETVIMVTDPVYAPWSFDPTLTGALLLLRDLIVRLHDIEGPVPWNAWLHHGNDTPWHIELVPRLSVLAGLELGAGIYVNSVQPEQAAEALRRATGRSRPATSQPGTS